MLGRTIQPKRTTDAVRIERKVIRGKSYFRTKAEFQSRE